MCVCGGGHQEFDILTDVHEVGPVADVGRRRSVGSAAIPIGGGRQCTEARPSEMVAPGRAGVKPSWEEAGWMTGERSLTEPTGPAGPRRGTPRTGFHGGSVAVVNTSNAVGTIQTNSLWDR